MKTKHKVVLTKDEKIKLDTLLSLARTSISPNEVRLHRMGAKSILERGKRRFEERNLQPH